MSNTRFVNGWECQLCNGLFSTERKAENCFNNLHDEDEEDKKDWDYTKAKAILIKGYECMDCLKLHESGLCARQCCYYEHPAPKDEENYDIINYPKVKLLKNIKGKKGK